MKERLQGLLHRLWDADAVARYPQYLVRVARYAFVLTRDLLDGQLNMRAMGLVYTTLLSIVPLLALAFSVLKALGVHNSLEPVLLELLRPLGAQAHTLTASIVGFVENIRVGVLGSLGVALLFYAVMSMIQKVEESFNFIWRIERPRRLSQKLGEYLAIVTVGPVLIFAALGITATVLNSAVVQRIIEIEPFGLLMFMLTQLLPYLLIIGLFTFLYSFVPNTRVHWIAAACGGLLAGVLWQTGSAVFASFVVNSTNYNAIYSGFAILIFLLIWLYLGWLILLIGCQLAFYVQHPEFLKPQKVPPTLSGKHTEYLALMIMGLTGRRFLSGEPGYTEEELSIALNAAPEHVARVTDNLIFHQLLTETGEDRTRLLPAMDLDSILLSRLWRLSRAGSESLPKTADALAPEVLRLLDSAEDSFEKHAGKLSLRQWLTAPPR
jgi:membrane protein